jgi:hypothetical protein
LSPPYLSSEHPHVTPSRGLHTYNERRGWEWAERIPPSLPLLYRRNISTISPREKNLFTSQKVYLNSSILEESTSYLGEKESEFVVNGTTWKFGCFPVIILTKSLFCFFL